MMFDGWERTSRSISSAWRTTSQNWLRRTHAEQRQIGLEHQPQPVAVVVDFRLHGLCVSRM